MKAGVWRVRLETAAPPPPDRAESWSRGAAATAAIAEREGKYEVIVFLVILTGVFLHFFVLDRDCLSQKQKEHNNICARNKSGREREACVCKI